MQMLLGARHLALVIVTALALTIAPVSAVQETSSDLPMVELDVLEGFLWSSTELALAPGQVILITNRDVSRHTFTIDIWGVDLSLSTLKPVVFTIPESAEVGTSVEYYSSIPGDREGGLVGTISIVSPEVVLTGILISTGLRLPEPAPRVRIEARDDFTFQPAIVSVAAGTLVEVVNTGVISHHFVVDAWNVNQTIAPGGMVLVRVPADVEPGTVIDFYCSVPGHEQQGMVGVLRIAQSSRPIADVVQTRDGRVEPRIDMRSFLPGESALGSGWTRLRSGSSESVLGHGDYSADVFPYSGLGAVYVGPDGARVSLVVLPIRTDSVPNNQVSSAVQTVQSSLATGWSVDRIASAAWRSVSPPEGCTVAERVSGVVPTVTLPGGVTSCQLTGVGVVIVVSVEGEYDGLSGVNASDHLVEKIVTGEFDGGE
ncbi:MAG: cupredoxin domain-containing protein [Thermomicrobiales bacterium]|nr:cupredoxin domain-containing protein [Thermomicrobiales bacterium]